MVNQTSIQDFTVLAFDPGVTTGIALGRWSDGLLTIASRQSKLSHGQFYDELKDEAPLYIVCEDFSYRNKSKAGLVLYSVELIGIARLYEEQGYSGTRLFMQPPMKGKEGSTHYDDKKLKDLGLYQALRGGHANDAVRHLLQWYSFKFGYQFNKRGFEAA